MKLNKLLLTSVVALGLVSSAYALGTKIATVNVAEILKDSPVVAKAKAGLQSKYKPQYNKIEAAQKQMQADINNLKKNGPTMSEDARKAAQTKIGGEQQTLMAEQQKFQQQLVQAQQAVMATVLKQLQSVIKDVAIKSRYTFVLPKGAVAYAADNLDITAQVSKAFNAEGLPSASSESSSRSSSK